VRHPPGDIPQRARMPLNPGRAERLMVRAIPAISVSEALIEKACTDILIIDDWRALRTDPVSRREWGKGFGEKGMADHLYIRYEWSLGAREAKNNGWERWNAHVLWIEFKKLDKRGKPTAAAPHQRLWQAAERARGALVLQAGIDFPATIEGFREWYKTSGLMRRKILS
jgi:hypothetical protein